MDQGAILGASRGRSGLATARLATAFGRALGGPGRRHTRGFPANLGSVRSAADVAGGWIFSGVSRLFRALGASGSHSDDLSFGRRRDDDEWSWGGGGAFGFHEF